MHTTPSPQAIPRRDVGEGRQAAAPVPEHVLRLVRGALDELRHTADTMQRVRVMLDGPRLGIHGGGRYEADVVEDRAEAVARAVAALAKFRAAAAKNGVDPEAVLRDLGGVPDLTPSPAGAAHLAESRDATGRCARFVASLVEGGVPAGEAEEVAAAYMPSGADAASPAVAPERMGQTKTV